MNKDLIDRQQAIEGVKELFSMGDCYCDEFGIIGMLNTMPSVQLPSDEYNRGWHDGRKALREEIWEYDRDRLD